MSTRKHGSTAVALGLLLALACGGCLSKRVMESLETVGTLQMGAVSELRDKRGTGPFRPYAVAPKKMLTVVERAARKARGAAGDPVEAVFVYEASYEIVAKERAPDEADDTGYGGTWRTAVYVAVHPIRGRKDACRLEIHAVRRGPFHGGVVAWQRDLPRWIDEVLAEMAAADAAPIAPLPR